MPCTAFGSHFSFSSEEAREMPEVVETEANSLVFFFVYASLRQNPPVPPLWTLFSIHRVRPHHLDVCLPVALFAG